MKTILPHALFALLAMSCWAHGQEATNPNLKTKADYPVPPLKSLKLPNVTCPIPGYTLRWADEFNDKTVNTDWWWYRVREAKVRAERQSQVSIVHKDGNGFLRIRCEKAKKRGGPYLGGGLITKFQLRYGYYETRVKMGPRGWHEAFWTSISNFQKGKDAYAFSTAHERMEVDCFEHFDRHDKEMEHGFHRWRGKKSKKQGRTFKHSESLSNDFHTFGFEYTPKTLGIYVDGKKAHTYDISGAAKNWFFLILSSIKHGKVSAADGDVLWDYVRFYEPK